LGVGIEVDNLHFGLRRNPGPKIRLLGSLVARIAALEGDFVGG
jgi:hypothetical protein